MLELDVDTKACANRLAFFQFLFKAGFLVGARITVIVEPAKSDSNQGDKIIAAALWLPPRSRLAIWMVPTMVKAGVIQVLKRWGLTGLQVRISMAQTPSILTPALSELCPNIKQPRSQQCTSFLRTRGSRGRPMTRGTFK